MTSAANMREKSPKVVLSEFYQRYQTKPEYNCEALPKSSPMDSPGFKCTLYLPEVKKGDIYLPPHQFSGEGRSKKLAEEQAAELALDFLPLLPTCKALNKPKLLEAVYDAALLHGMRRNPKLSSHYLQFARAAQRRNEPFVWFPVSMLLLVKNVELCLRGTCDSNENARVLNLLNVVTAAFEGSPPAHNGHIASGNGNATRDTSAQLEPSARELWESDPAVNLRRDFVISADFHSLASRSSWRPFNVAQSKRYLNFDGFNRRGQHCEDSDYEEDAPREAAAQNLPQSFGEAGELESTANLEGPAETSREGGVPECPPKSASTSQPRKEETRQDHKPDTSKDNFQFPSLAIEKPLLPPLGRDEPISFLLVPAATAKPPQDVFVRPDDVDCPRPLVQDIAEALGLEGDAPVSSQLLPSVPPPQDPSASSTSDSSDLLSFVSPYRALTGGVILRSQVGHVFSYRADPATAKQVAAEKEVLRIMEGSEREEEYPWTSNDVCTGIESISAVGSAKVPQPDLYSRLDAALRNASASAELVAASMEVKSLENALSKAVASSDAAAVSAADETAAGETAEFDQDQNSSDVDTLRNRLEVAQQRKMQAQGLVASARASFPLNVRATYLAGEPVYGDAVLTLCQPLQVRRYGDNGKSTVFCWKGYSRDDLSRSLLGLMPSSMYARISSGVQTLTRLPRIFWSSSVWVGDFPMMMLANICLQRGWPTPTVARSVLDVESPNEGTLAVEVRWLGRRRLMARVSTVGDMTVIEHRAALALLHRIEELDAAALHGEDPVPRNLDAMEDPWLNGEEVLDVDAPEVREEAEASLRHSDGFRPGSPEEEEEFRKLEVEVLDPGHEHARQLDPESKRVVRLRVSVTLVDENGVLFELEPEVVGTFITNVGMLPYAVERALATRNLACGAAIRIRGLTSLRAEGWDSLRFLPYLPYLPYACDVNIGIQSVKSPCPAGYSSSASAACGPSFTPSLALQRMKLVAGLLRDANLDTVLDVGCGDARLFEAMVNAGFGCDSGGPLRRALGVDVSAKATKGAARRLEALSASRVRGEDEMDADIAAGARQAAEKGDVSTLPDVRVCIYRGSALDPDLLTSSSWADEASGSGSNVAAEGEEGVVAVPSAEGGDLIVTMVEVVEHLDAPVLDLVGPCVLGAMAPKVFVVTTPNWDYNAVIREADAGSAKMWNGPKGRDGQPLRNSDHRFEWSQAEFREWAEKLGSEWGYDVKFQGVGTVKGESKVLAGKKYNGLQQPELGFATQVAILRRRQDSNAGPQRSSLLRRLLAGEGEEARLPKGAVTEAASAVHKRRWTLEAGPMDVRKEPKF